MTADIEDLTPFFADRCWMFVLLAREASVGVILRRGQTKWWHVTLWDTRTDKFQSGQWFHGQMLSGQVRCFSRRQVVHLFRWKVSPAGCCQNLDCCLPPPVSNGAGALADRQ